MGLSDGGGKKLKTMDGDLKDGASFQDEVIPRFSPRFSVISPTLYIIYPRMTNTVYYFELRESRTGRLRLEFMGSEFDVLLRDDYIGSRHFKADDIGISVDSIYAYLTVNDDFYSHIGIHGHHEDEDGAPQEEWSEDKKKYENMRHIIKFIENEWNEIAQTLRDRTSHVEATIAAIAAVNDIEF